MRKRGDSNRAFSYFKRTWVFKQPYLEKFDLGYALMVGIIYWKSLKSAWFQKIFCLKAWS